MESSKIHEEKEQYRIVERENSLGEKFYFLQYCWFGFNFFKFSFIKMKYNKEPIRSVLAWIYVFRVVDKNLEKLTAEPYLIEPTMDFTGRTTPVDLNKHIKLACKSKEEAMDLMHEYTEHLEKSRKKNAEKKIEHEAKKKEDNLKKLTLKEKILEI